MKRYRELAYKALRNAKIFLAAFWLCQVFFFLFRVSDKQILYNAALVLSLISLAITITYLVIYKCYDIKADKEENKRIFIDPDEYDL